MRAPRKTAAVTGSITRDRIRTRRGSAERIGGAVWYAGSTFVQLGMSTRAITRFAIADAFIEEALQRAGIEVLQRPSLRTTTFVNDYTVPGDVDRKQEVLALADPIRIDELRAGLNQCDLVYLAPLHPDDISDAALTMVVEEKTFTIALDVQGYTRAIVAGKVEARVDSRLSYLRSACDVIKANASEARILTGSTDPSKAAVDLVSARNRLESVVTCGSDGVYIASGKILHFQPVVELDIDDPTGAGDIFFAAYLVPRMQGKSIGSAARFAAKFTARSLRDLTRAGMLTLL